MQYAVYCAKEMYGVMIASPKNNELSIPQKDMYNMKETAVIMALSDKVSHAAVLCTGSMVYFMHSISLSTS